jgi:probable addiction module antidote protein
MVKISELKTFDAAEVLDTAKAQEIYLRLILEDGDPDEFLRALGTVARARGMTDVAKAAGITREGLYKAFGEGGNPSYATVASVVRALGITLTMRKPRRRRAA